WSVTASCSGCCRRIWPPRPGAAAVGSGGETQRVPDGLAGGQQFHELPPHLAVGPPLVEILHAEVGADERQAPPRGPERLLHATPLVVVHPGMRQAGEDALDESAAPD